MIRHTDPAMQHASPSSVPSASSAVRAFESGASHTEGEYTGAVMHEQDAPGHRKGRECIAALSLQCLWTGIRPFEAPHRRVLPVPF